MNTSAANNNKEGTRMDSKKRKAKTLPQPKNRNEFTAEQEIYPGDDYIVPGEDESRLLTEEGTKNEKKNIAKRKYKILRDLYAGTSRQDEENPSGNDAVFSDVDETTAKNIKTSYENQIVKLNGKLEASNKIIEELKRQNTALSLQLEECKSAYQKDDAVNEKEKVEEKRTRPKRATKTAFDYDTFDYSQMPREKKNMCEQGVNQKPQKTMKDRNSESDMEGLQPTHGELVFDDVYPETRNLDNSDNGKKEINQKIQKTVTDSDSKSDSKSEDLVFDDFYPATRNFDKADKDELVNMNRLRQIVWTCPKRHYEVIPPHCLKLVSNDYTIDSVVGSWMSILEDEFKDIPNVPTCYLGNMYFRLIVRNKSKSGLKRELRLMKGKRLLCFPVCTPISRNPYETPNHWTLIVLDVKERKWTHFNTLSGKGRDWNYHHNQELMDWVDENLWEEYVQTERENYKDTPQQPNGSVDCGICVLMILEQLMLGKTKEQIKDMFKLEFNKKKVAKYRTRMVQTFLRLGKIQKEQEDVACGNIQHELKDVNLPNKYS